MGEALCSSGEYCSVFPREVMSEGGAGSTACREGSGAEGGEDLLN
jgi:hypothetical protein